MKKFFVTIIGVFLAFTLMMQSFAVAETFPVEYMPGADNVSNLPESTTGVGGQPFTVSSQEPVKDGYIFLGWELDMSLGCVLRYQVAGDPQYGIPGDAILPPSQLCAQGSRVTLAPGEATEWKHPTGSAPETVSCTVNYLRYGTEIAVADPKIVTGCIPGSSITVTAPDLSAKYCSLHDGELSSKTIPVSQEPEGTWIFTGWCRDANCTVPVTVLENISEDTTVYGKWEYAAAAAEDNVINFYYDQKLTAYSVACFDRDYNLVPGTEIQYVYDQIPWSEVTVTAPRVPGWRCLGLERYSRTLYPDFDYSPENGYYNAFEFFYEEDPNPDGPYTISYTVDGGPSDGRTVEPQTGIESGSSVTLRPHPTTSEGPDYQYAINEYDARFTVSSPAEGSLNRDRKYQVEMRTDVHIGDWYFNPEEGWRCSIPVRDEEGYVIDYISQELTKLQNVTKDMNVSGWWDTRDNPEYFVENVTLTARFQDEFAIDLNSPIIARVIHADETFEETTVPTNSPQLTIAEGTDGITQLSYNFGDVHSTDRVMLLYTIQAKADFIGSNNVFSNSNAMPVVSYSHGENTYTFEGWATPEVNVPVHIGVHKTERVSVSAGTAIDLADHSAEAVDAVRTSLCKYDQTNGTITFAWQLPNGSEIRKNTVHITHGILDSSLPDLSQQWEADEAGIYIAKLHATFAPDRVSDHGCFADWQTSVGVEAGSEVCLEIMITVE